MKESGSRENRHRVPSALALKDRLERIRSPAPAPSSIGTAGAGSPAMEEIGDPAHRLRGLPLFPHNDDAAAGSERWSHEVVNDEARGRFVEVVELRLLTVIDAPGGSTCSATGTSDGARAVPPP
jgi:hypothetical protein